MVMAGDTKIELTIKSPRSFVTFKKEFTMDEWDQSGYVEAFKNARRKHTAFPWTGLIIPIRVNNLKNFAKDFFLPTTVNMAIKTNRLGLRIIAVFGSLLLDTITFPIRLLTVIPRSIAALTHKKKETELHKFLIRNGVPESLLSGDYIQFRTETYNALPEEATAFEKLVGGMRAINFDRVPLRYVPMGALILNQGDKN